MNFFSETVKFFNWFGRVFRSFWSERPTITFFVILTSVIARVTSFLAFILPLKVVLLAGSDGVPRYFRYFIDPSEKNYWIIVLSSLAFLFYILTLVLDSISERLCASSSEAISIRANEISVIANQGDKVKKYYSIACQIWAAAVFALCGFAVLALLNPLLLACLAGLLLFSYLVPHLMLFKLNRVSPSGFSGYLYRDSKGYISIVKSINFLIGFVVILAPFLLGMPANISIAIISIILLSQILTAFTSSVSNCIFLAKRRDFVNPLVFREVHLLKREKHDAVVLASLLHRECRLEWVRRQLTDLVSEGDNIVVNWKDPTIRNMKVLTVSSSCGFSSSSENLQLQMFPPSSVSYVNNESFLFDRISRSELGAPNFVGVFVERGIECRVFDYGLGEIPAVNQRSVVECTLLQKHWSVSPPYSLVEAYGASHPLLHERISSKLLDRVEVAVNTSHDVELLSAFRSKLSIIKTIVKGLPVYVHNPDMRLTNIVLGNEGDKFVLMNWGRWAIEPIGVRLPFNTSQEGIAEMLESVRLSRKDLPEDFSVDAIYFVSSLSKFEVLVKKHRYRLAIEMMEAILSSPLISEKRHALEVF